MCFRSLIEHVARVAASVAFAAFGVGCSSSPKPVARQVAPPFRICAEPEGLPMSSESRGGGFEIEVARILAQELGRSLEVAWVPHRDPSYYRMSLGNGGCEAIMSVPTGFERLATTRPWYRTSFVLVMAAAKRFTPRSLDDPRLRKLVIAVPETGDGETPPALSFTRRKMQNQLRPYSILAPRELVEAVRTGEADAAAVWGPFAGWYVGEDPTALAIEPLRGRDGGIPLAFDMSIGVKKTNTALRDALDRAIERRRPDIVAVLEKWRVPLQAAPARKGGS